MIKNFVNIELFHKDDALQEDCVGWITIMEKADEDLRTVLKDETLGILERKKIAKGIEKGCKYLENIEINHCDLKLANFLLLAGDPKIADFGMIEDLSGRSGYRKMGYARRGSKFKNQEALCKIFLKN